MKNETKVGEVEYSKREDGKYAVYKFMADPNISQTDPELASLKDFTSTRWVLVDVVNELPKSR